MTREIALIIISSLFSASTIGQIVMYVIHKRDRLKKIEKVVERLSEGVSLGLQNDIVIFNAFRHNHINGESERQEIKMKEYFYKNTNKGLEL